MIAGRTKKMVFSFLIFVTHPHFKKKIKDRGGAQEHPLYPFYTVGVIMK